MEQRVQELPLAPAMALALTANFGSVQRWRDAFVAMGKAPGGGSGPVMLVFQPHDCSLVNQSAAEHTQAPAGGIALLALNMNAHTQAQEFDIATARDADALLDNIVWSAVYERYQNAAYGASEAFGATPAESKGVVFLDVRRDAIYQAAPTQIEGAQWRDPAKVGEWAPTLPKDQAYVVYCIYGHEVSRATAMRMRAAGLNAHYLRGGMDGWQAAGLPVQAKATATATVTK